MNLFGLLSVAFITSLFPHTSFLRLPDPASGSFFVKTSFAPRFSQIALMPIGAKTAHPIAAKSQSPRRLEVAPRIRPAVLTILPSSMIPLAVSLWQRQLLQPQDAHLPKSEAITVQRANRFISSSTGATAWQCQRSTARKQPLKQTAFQVRVNDRVVAQFPSQTQATVMATRLRSLLASGVEGDRLQLKLINGLPAGVVDDETLFLVDERTTKAMQRSSDLVAIDWINQLRLAFDAAPLSLSTAQMQLYGLTETRSKLSGIASWYGPYFHGRLTAAGEIFNEGELTAAHPTLPFDTFLKVINLETGKTVVVRINDRGPYVGERSLDLSREAARCLGSETSGVVNYRAVILKPETAVAQSQPPDQRSSADAIALNSTR